MKLSHPCIFALEASGRSIRQFGSCPLVQPGSLLEPELQALSVGHAKCLRRGHVAVEELLALAVWARLGHQFVKPACELGWWQCREIFNATKLRSPHALAHSPSGLS